MKLNLDVVRPHPWSTDSERWTAEFCTECGKVLATGVGRSAAAALAQAWDSLAWAAGRTVPHGARR